MITRGQMPRQLRNKGGITNVVPRDREPTMNNAKDVKR